MNLSINEQFFRRKYGDTKPNSFETSIKQCKNAGFDYIDFALMGISPVDNMVLRENYIEQAKTLREYCDKSGVKINQTHASIDFDKNNPEAFVDTMIKTVKVSKLLGAQNVVVHADTYHAKDSCFDFEDALKKIYEIYVPMVDEAKKQNIKIAMETLFDVPDFNGKHKRFTAYIEELDAIVSMFHDPIVGICWDFGHARISYSENQFEQMKKVGNKIIATHVHDNYFNNDLHTLPFLGETDWEMAMRTLKEVGYRGDLTLELVFGCLPEELLEDFLKFTYKVGNNLINKFNQY